MPASALPTHASRWRKSDEAQGQARAFRRHRRRRHERHRRGAAHAGLSGERLGCGDVADDADESDASFLVLQPVLAVITNIDADHMETYEHDFARLKEAFLNFAQRLPFYGTAVLCMDDPNVREIAPAITKSIVGYGVGDEAQLRATGIEHHSGRMRFVAKHARHRDLSIDLNLAGVHNVQNALAAIAVGREVGVAD